MTWFYNLMFMMMFVMTGVNTAILLATAQYKDKLVKMPPPPGTEWTPLVAPGTRSTFHTF